MLIHWKVSAMCALYILQLCVLYSPTQADQWQQSSQLIPNPHTAEAWPRDPGVIPQMTTGNDILVIYTACSVSKCHVTRPFQTIGSLHVFTYDWFPEKNTCTFSLSWTQRFFIATGKTIWRATNRCCLIDQQIWWLISSSSTKGSKLMTSSRLLWWQNVDKGWLWC